MTNKDAMLWFFRHEDSESLSDLVRFFSEQIGEVGGEVGGEVLSMREQEEIAIDLFSSKCEENEDLLVWLTADDAQKVADLFGFSV